MLSFKKAGVIGRTYRTYRNLNRYRQIISILFKYGFGDILKLLKIDRIIESAIQLFSKKRKDKVEKFSKPERLRMAIEELGVTFIKFGQILSTRPDLIPVEYTFELAKLQDEVPPFPYDEVCKVVVKELGAHPKELFYDFEERAIASASIGQVHRAVLKNGRKVAVKVQRPNICKTIEVDLEIMMHLAYLIEHNIDELALHRPLKIVEEFARTLEKEVDYSIESTNLERIANQFVNDQTIYVPKIYKDLSSERVLTMEYINGIKISDIQKIDEAGLDRKIIVKHGVQLILKQVFKHGFFHADPHPGNIFILDDNIICFLDFGMVGSVDRKTREDFVDLIDSLVTKDESLVTRALLNLTNRDVEPDIRLLEKDVADLMGRHLYKPLKEIESDKLLKQLLQLAARYRLRVRPDIFLMAKASSAIEGVARMLDPEADIIALSAPFIAQVKLSKFMPKRIGREMLKISSESIDLVKEFPMDAMEIIRMIKEQKLGIKIDIKSLDKILINKNQLGNRVILAVIMASLIIGSSVIVFGRIQPFLFGISAIGLIGFFITSILGILLIISIANNK